MVDKKDAKHDSDGHKPQRHHSKREAVAAFEALGQPVDDHTYEEDDEYASIVGQDVGDIALPRAADAGHHILGGVPGHLVGFGRVEIGAAAEKESGKGDEDESEEDAPDLLDFGFRPGGFVPVAQGIDNEVAQNGACAYYAGPHHADLECRRRPDDIEEQEKGKEGFGGHNAGPRGLFFPPFIDKDAHTVEAAPGDEVETGAVPHSAQQHRVHIVDVGVELLAVAREDEVDGYQGADDGGDDQRDPRRLGHQGHDDEHSAKDDVAGGTGTAVAAQGDVEIVLQPVAERHMPSFPEPCGAGGLVGRVEVLRQVEAHQHCHSDGYVGIARKVGIDLQRIDEQRREVFEACVEQRVFEDAVDEIDGQVVAKDYLLHQAVEYPEHGDAELAAAEEVGLVELRDELVGTHNGACHKLGEEGGIESEVEDVGGVAYLVLVDIDYVTDILKGEEGYAHGQQYLGGVEGGGLGEVVGKEGQMVHDLMVGVEDVVVDVGEEVGIFEVEQHQQVDNHANDHQQFGARRGGAVAFRRHGTACRGLASGFVGAAVHPDAEEVAQQGGKDKQKDEKPRGLEVEEEADEEEVAVADGELEVGPARVVGVAFQHFGPEPGSLYEAESGKDNKEEGPEVELGEKQRMLLVEREEVSKKCN